MRIEIRGRNVEIEPSLRSHIERQLSFAMGRFGPRIEWLTVRVEDVNGPRGGNDKRCRIEVDLIRSKNVMVEEFDSDPYTAAARAVTRAGRSVARQLGRKPGARAGKADQLVRGASEVYSG